MYIRWTIPNILSAYRLLMFPVIAAYIFLHQETPFVWLISINLITDIADGFIARAFKLETKEGAILDSLADIGSYVLAIFGIYQFHYYVYTDYGNFLMIFIILYVLTLIVPLFKFGRPSTGLHLYSAKIAGYLQGIFLFVLFVFGMKAWLFYLAMIVGYYSEIEGLIINLISKKPILNAKTIFHCINSNFKPNE